MDKQALEWLTQLREHEMSLLLSHFPPPRSRVLEIGGGTGHQAAFLAARGWNIESVEIANSPYATERVFAITDYDGRHLPFPDASFDVVFSSNVLEHVPQLDEFERELARVLRAGGYAIHVLPSHHWRRWTSIVHYAALPRLIMRAIEQRKESRGRAAATLDGRGQSGPGTRDHPVSFVAWLTKLTALFQTLAIASRHRERGTAVSEYFVYFRAWWWMRHFRAHGFDVEEHFAMGVFYTGNMLLEAHLPIDLRVKLARVLGSSANCFVLRNRS